MAYRIQIATPARQHAKSYAAFIHDDQKSPEAARRWLDGLYAAINELTEVPTRFSVIPEADELGFPYGSLVYHSNRVVYAVYDVEQCMMIDSVQHGARESLIQQNMQ